MNYMNKYGTADRCVGGPLGFVECELDEVGEDGIKHVFIPIHQRVGFNLWSLISIHTIGISQVVHPTETSWTHLNVGERSMRLHLPSKRVAHMIQHSIHAHDLRPAPM